jgi:hypothetical protein
MTVCTNEACECRDPFANRWPACATPATTKTTGDSTAASCPFHAACGCANAEGCPNVWSAPTATKKKDESGPVICPFFPACGCAAAETCPNLYTRY